MVGFVFENVEGRVNPPAYAETSPNTGMPARIFEHLPIPTVPSRIYLSSHVSLTFGVKYPLWLA
jgi:hypothetical protein